eukprot:Em0007g1291a
MENCSDSSDDEFDGYLYEDEHSANNDDSGEEDCDEPSSATNVCQGRQRIAFSEAPGVVPHMTGKIPLDFFHLFFDDEVKHIIHSKSCENAVRYLEENQEFLTTHPHARAHDWVKAPMSLKEVDALLSIVIAMGLVGLPTQRSYWSSQLPFRNENISTIMSSRRFELLLKFFHISSPPDQPLPDKLQKIRPLLDTVVKNFKAAYVPAKNLSIDESMISFKGRLSWGNLFADLQKAGFEACGTVEVYTERIFDDSLLCLKWQDKRDVLLLSTLHDDSIVEVQRRSRLVTRGVEGIKKPKVVHEYNQHMGGVDQIDQLLMYYGCSHRQVKWWKRVFFHLLGLSIVNASVLYNIVNTKQLTQLEFRVEVANGLPEGYTRRQPRHFTVSQELPLRLTERPFPEKVDTDTPHGGCPRCEVVWTDEEMQVVWTGEEMQVVWTGEGMQVVWTDEGMQVVWTDEGMQVVWTGEGMQVVWAGEEMKADVGIT